MIELKTCPFCGSEAKLFVGEGGVCVVCTSCGCRTGCRDDTYSLGLSLWRKYKKISVDLVIEEWNRRTGERDDSISD